MRPDLVSYEYLGLKNAGWIIMLLNNCSSLFNFVSDKLSPNGIYVPTYDILEKIMEESNEI